MAKKYRSALEKRVADAAARKNCVCEYEPFKIDYSIPERITRYTPDFLLPNGILIEVKGYWNAADRKKHRLLRAQHPELDIRFVFSNPWSRIGKNSDTTYGDYCDKRGWQYAKGEIPSSWLEEPSSAASKKYAA